MARVAAMTAVAIAAKVGLGEAADSQWQVMTRLEGRDGESSAQRVHGAAGAGLQAEVAEVAEAGSGGGRDYGGGVAAVRWRQVLAARAAKCGRRGRPRKTTRRWSRRALSAEVGTEAGAGAGVGAGAGAGAEAEGCARMRQVV